jgi:hypothetical protein
MEFLNCSRSGGRALESNADYDFWFAANQDPLRNVPAALEDGNDVVWGGARHQACDFHGIKGRGACAFDGELVGGKGGSLQSLADDGMVQIGSWRAGSVVYASGKGVVLLKHVVRPCGVDVALRYGVWAIIGRAIAV